MMRFPHPIDVTTKLALKTAVVRKRLTTREEILQTCKFCCLILFPTECGIAFGFVVNILVITQYQSSKYTPRSKLQLQKWRKRRFIIVSFGFVSVSRQWRNSGFRGYAVYWQAAMETTDSGVLEYARAMVNL